MTSLLQLLLKGLPLALLQPLVNLLGRLCLRHKPIVELQYLHLLVVGLEGLVDDVFAHALLLQEGNLFDAADFGEVGVFEEVEGAGQGFGLLFGADCAGGGSGGGGGGGILLGRH